MGMADYGDGWLHSYNPGMSDEDRPYFEHGMAQRVRNARAWIEGHITLVEGIFFEDACLMYPDQSALNYAWCDEFGGI